MNLEKYPYYANASFFDFEFDSIGPKGVIRKVARFSSIGQNIYNLGFGDLNEKNGEISDTVISNNGDGEKILATVGGIIYDFTGRFSNAAIFVKGTTSARTRWYQMGINKNWEEINKDFEVFGYRNEKWEPFRKSRNYEAFFGRRKTSFLL
ncbi:MAG: hypothetical protein JWM28_2211 [Chitinophagaceae bacterium]|nr:hypothetical protein [Chitinophagaceae bacterium]